MSLTYALLLPFVLAIVSILDKYVVSKRVQNYRAYLIVIAIAQFIISVIIAIFLDWSSVDRYGAIFGVMSGFFVGLSTYSYYYLLRTEDASHVIGLSYLYPILVALLSYFFLEERFTLPVYIGVILTVSGAILLSSRWPQFKTKALVPMSFIVLFTGLYQFLIKIASNYISEWHGIVLTSAGIILAFLPMLFIKSSNKDLPSELKNIKFALIIEGLAFLEFLITYLAMEKIPATVVTTISATQPLVILFYESVGEKFGIHMAKQHWKEKLLPIILIVIGIVLIYSKFR